MPPTSRVCRIALLQAAAEENRAENVAKALERVREAAKAGAQVICLQELFSSPYFCQEENPDWFDSAEPIPGPTSEALQDVAQALGVVVIAPIFERRAAGVHHNSAAVIDADGALAGVYRKMHIPDDPLYYEKYYFSPGDRGFQAFDTKFARIGVLICWDQWYPEAARLTALRGAEILFFPSAIGWHPSEKQSCGKEQFEAWRLVQQSHSVANGVFSAVVNRVGRECPLTGSPSRPRDYEGIDFWGGSFVCDPMGKITAEAARESEELLLADCDLESIETTRRHWPFLRDRRVDAYAGLTARLLDEHGQR